jgi:hypothetical protein
VEVLDIAVNPDWSLDVAVCLSGFSDGNKVFISDDGGTTWTNISGTLPNLPFNCIEWAPGSNDGLYVGGDVGVYYRDTDIGDWIPFRNGLPHTPIYDLEIYEAGNILRVGTHGRGVWQTNTYTPCPTNYSLNVSNLPGSGSQGYRYYQASDAITSSRSIDGGIGTNVTYQAGNSVTLTSGFEVAQHSTFTAISADCNTWPSLLTMGQEITGVYAGPMEGVVEEVVGIEEVDEEEEYLLVYPNPTNGLVNIEFSLRDITDVSLLITDLFGRNVATVMPRKELPSGSYKVSHNLENLSAGFYVCTLLKGEKISTTRIAVTN